MRLGAKVLKNFCNYNDFSYTPQHEMNEGENSRIYIQLCDLDQRLCSSIDGTFFQRYMPPEDSTLELQIASVDGSQTITRYATQDANDPSLWFIDLLPTDVIPSGNIHLTLTEDGPVTRKAVITEGIKVYPSGAGSVSFC